MDIDIIPDQFSSEVISVMVVERLWSKIKIYLDEKKAKKLEDKVAELERKIDNG